jgi:hypothetical protein
MTPGFRRTRAWKRDLLPEGKTACKGRTVRMDTLDTLVVEHLSERLFTTERLTAILAATFARRAEKAVEVDRRVVSLQRDVTDAADKLKRLYRLVEEGIAELDDILTDRIASLKRDRTGADRARPHPGSGCSLWLKSPWLRSSNSAAPCVKTLPMAKSRSANLTSERSLTVSRWTTQESELLGTVQRWNR